MNNGPRIYRIVDHFEENATCRTMRFDDAMTAQPGQFLMIWIPGEDELPMSVSYIGDRFGITYKIVGEDEAQKTAAPCAANPLRIATPSIMTPSLPR